MTLLFQQRRVQELMEEAIPKSKGAKAEFSNRPERFGEYMRRQGRMVETRDEVLGNSKTTQRAGDDLQVAGSMLGQMVNRWRSSPSLANMAIEAVAEGWKRIFGFRDDVALALAKRLTATDPAERARVLAAVQARMGKDRFGQLADYLDAVNNRVTALASRQAGDTAADRAPPDTAAAQAQPLSEQQRAQIINQAVGSLTTALQKTAKLDAGTAQQIAQRLLEPDPAKLRQFLRQIEQQQGPRAAKAIDDAFGAWLMQYQANPTQPR